MALERTLSIVKPDGVARNLVGDVYQRFEKAGLRIVGARMLQLTQRQAEGSMPFTARGRSSAISVPT